MEIHFAPMQGYADHIYRRLHARIYGGADCYYTPFIRIEKGMPRRQDMVRLKESSGDGTPLVPQIIFGSADEFRCLTEALKTLGVNRIDLNMGCPYPMQTGRGRGAATIGNVDMMEEVGRLILSDPSTSYSVKMRLGMESPDEWEALMPVLNSLPLAHIAIHPRVARQMYGGELHMGEASRLMAASSNPVILNGGILSTADIGGAEKHYPTLKGVMVGRGFLARPSLGAEWRSGSDWPEDKRMTHLLLFHDELLKAYESALWGPVQILQKIKPFWDYLEPEIGRKAAKAIRKSSTLSRYLDAVCRVRTGGDAIC